MDVKRNGYHGGDPTFCLPITVRAQSPGVRIMGGGPKLRGGAPISVLTQSNSTNMKEEGL